MTTNLAIFEGHQIRRHYDEKTETWWFSVVDIVRVLTQQPDFTTARKYWNKLKERLSKEGSQLVTSCHQLKMRAEDGKQRLTGMGENKVAAKTGGRIARKARLELESKTGQKVVSGENFLPPATPIKQIK